METNKNMTFGEYIFAISKDNKLTSNHNNYQTLYNALSGVNARGGGKESHFAPPMFDGVLLKDIPLNEINNNHFVAFGDWIKFQYENKGYRNKMGSFVSVIRAAHKEGLNNNALFFEYCKEPNCPKYDKRQVNIVQ